MAAQRTAVRGAAETNATSIAEKALFICRQPAPFTVDSYSLANCLHVLLLHWPQVLAALTPYRGSDEQATEFGIEREIAHRSAHGRNLLQRGSARASS